MEKKSLLALVLISLLTMGYFIYAGSFAPKEPRRPYSAKGGIEVDTSSIRTQKSPELKAERGKFATPDTTISERIVRVETNLYRAYFSSKGAVLKSFLLKQYRYSDNGNQIELIPQDSPGSLGILFSDSTLFSFQVDLDSLILNDVTQRGTITFSGRAKDGTTITKKYTFYNNQYHFNLELEVSESEQVESRRAYALAWSSGLTSTEKDTKEDLSYFEAYSMMGQELRSSKKFKKQSGTEIEVMEESNSGQTEWVATKTKYFLASMVPLSKKGTGFSVYGERWFTGQQEKRIEHKRIAVLLEMPIAKGSAFRDSFMVYLGPLDYSALKDYKIGLENTVDLGWKIIKPFSIAILWIFVNLHKVIPNYGLVIIVFTILMKIVLHPLTHKSTKSMSKMQELQPKITQLREKHKDDTQRMNQEMMKLYKEHGVNPLGGCLPLLLQMPLFYGLFVIFRTTIELRGAEFAWWLKDLSQKDPYYILPLIMSIAMFWQQKITMKDPKQKAMVYLMPVLFFFLFKSFPAGLTLYWTLYNILSLVEQYYLKAKHTSEAVSA
ncbi:MAG: membrane protein insertase YidC [candidate division Zixibacteria bacterium]|nr:membrane protein insertase YidC [candidate division Zixibacteria bacterium]